MGGGEIIASFLDEQAIDEFVISVAPVFIGDGIPLIARRHRHVPLDLDAIERFDDGLVQLRYRVQDVVSIGLDVAKPLSTGGKYRLHLNIAQRL